MRTALIVSALALAAAACSPPATETTEPPIAEAPAPVQPAAVTLTEADARTQIEAAGYTDVTGLMQGADGTWTATGTRDGATTTVSVGPNGVTTTTTPPATTP